MREPSDDPSCTPMRAGLLLARPEGAGGWPDALRDVGVTPLICTTADDVLALAQEGGLHAVLVDPSAAGAADLSRALKTSPGTRHVPIVALTQRRGPAGDIAPWPEWADDVLAQPFSLDELRLRLRLAAEMGFLLERTRRDRWAALAATATPPSGSALAEEAALYRTASLVGRTIGGCRLLERLKRGRSDVYLGEHEVLGIRVCVKLFPVALGEWSPAHLARFLRGARAAARIDHPNVVPILNAGRDGDYYFLVRRYAEGRPLDALVRDGRPLPEETVLRVGRGAASGLAAAHALRVLHRDVKPANIILAPDGTPRLFDFDLARVVGDLRISTTGEVVGTPHYMPPEQCDGEPLDARADVYGLGATLYHLATGRPPFEGATVLELLHKQIHEDPPPVRALNPRIGAPLAAVIARMMAKAPAARYPSAEAVFEALASAAG